MKWFVALLALLSLPPLVADDEPQTPPPALLEVWHREIATFRTSLAGLSPAERRDAALARMRELPDFALYRPITRERMVAGDLEGAAFEIDGRRLFVLVAEDLDPTAGGTLEDRIDEVQENLEGLRKAWIDQRNAGVLLRGAGLSLAATAIFASFLLLLGRLGRLLRRAYIRRAARLRQLKRRDLDLRPVLLQLVRRLIGLAIAALGFAAGYVWITYLLGHFPYTAPWSRALGHHLGALGEHLLAGFLAALPGLLVVVLIFFLTRGTARIADQLLDSYEKSEDEGELLGKDTARATRRIAGLFIWIAGVIIAYPYIPGSDSPAFKGIGVLLGLMVSIGSSGFVNQLMSGFVVLYSGAVRSGEYVRVGEIEGTVTDIGLLSTKVRTPRREFVSLPNALLISRETFNYSRRDDSGPCDLSTSVTIGYDAPWRQVHELLLQAADRTPGIRDQPEPLVIQTALSDFYVEYELRFVPADPSRRGRILSDLHQRIQDAFHGAGLQIMSPHFVGQPEQAVLPPADSPSGGALTE